ncbi:MAG TPA: hypothetical protein VKQ36_16665 [Ktedonobacterales bacterium]|nr:hypothetical protein [Ktedonobacterales bacterium]
MSGMSEAQGQGITPTRHQQDQSKHTERVRYEELATHDTDAGALFDALEYAAYGESDDELATGAAEQGGVETLSEARRRAQTRQLIREFLRAVPRSEPETPLTFLRADGEARVITRRELSGAIDRLRPRQRQIVRLGIEERWPRQKVCAYLHDISIKTFERDQVEALDLLAQL